MERLQKWLAAQGLGSRREIEGWIRAGRLQVNGQVAELGTKVTGQERFALDGKPLRLGFNREKLATKILMYNKPLGEIVSQRDPQGRRTVFQSLPGAAGILGAGGRRRQRGNAARPAHRPAPGRRFHR